MKIKNPTVPAINNSGDMIEIFVSTHLLYIEFTFCDDPVDRLIDVYLVDRYENRQLIDWEKSLIIDDFVIYDAIDDYFRDFGYKNELLMCREEF